MLAVALLCTPAALADELWARDARSIHEEGFPTGVTTQALMGDGLPADPLAPDAGTVAYIVHRAGEGSASVIVNDPSTARYRNVVTLVGPFENASDIESFDPLLRSRNANDLDTLSTALYGAGQRSLAVEMQAKAVAALAPGDPRMEEYMKKLKQYVATENGATVSSPSNP